MVGRRQETRPHRDFAIQVSHANWHVIHWTCCSGNGQVDQRALPNSVTAEPEDAMSSDRWTKDQLKLAFHLYCQLPFGKMHGRNPEIIELATLIRHPDAKFNI